MLRAYSGMPSEEFITQLRTYVIALGLGPSVVDCVDGLIDFDDLETKHAVELDKVEEEAEKRGRKNMKDELIGNATHWLENHPDYDKIAEPCEAILALLEKVEI